jgi:Zinc carboxypeptidase
LTETCSKPTKSHQIGNFQPCSLTNPGQAAFSEAETSVLKHILTLFDSSIIIYAAMHSYGNYVLYPYSYALDTLVSNWEENQAAGDAFADAVFAVNGQAYQVGNTAHVLYPSNGSSKDYAAYDHSIRIAYTIELNGGGAEGFDLPPEEIYKSVTEVFQGFRALAAFTANSLNEQ